jgi:hypothetical protein
MKLAVIFLLALSLSGCAQSGDDFITEAPPGTNSGTDVPAAADPADPGPAGLIDSRFIGRINVSAAGAGQNLEYDFDTLFEFREKDAGKLIGYSQAWDRLQNGKLIIDFWASGQRDRVNVILKIPNPNPACSDIKFKGVFDSSGNMSFPKTIQKSNCKAGIFSASVSVTTDATVFTRSSDTIWPFWTDIETHFADK